MSGHPCGGCLRWPECNGTAWNTPGCPFCGGKYITTGGPVREALERYLAMDPEPDPLPPWPKINPSLYEDKTESGLFEED